eukprot:EG_transcript_5946
MQCGPTEERQGLLREFRFRDPTVERNYRQWQHGWAVATMRSHAFVVLALAGLSMLSYLGTPPADLPASFWIQVFPIVVSLALLFFLHIQRSVALLRRYLIPIFCLLCTSLTLFLAFLLWLWPQEWLAHTQRGSLWAELAPALTPEAQEKLRVLLLGSYLPTSVTICMMMNLSQLTFLLLVSFGWWSLAASWMMLPAFTVAIASSPISASLTLSLTICRIAMLCGGCTLLGAQLALMQRSNFLSELLLAQQQRQSEMADSVLNHGLKNTMADAASNVELFLNGELPATALQDSLISLRRGMRSCKERQLYLKLVAGHYEPALLPTNLEDFGQQLIAGRRVVGHFSPRTVMLDPMLCSLIFDNAIHNAFCHGHPEDPHVHFSIGEGEEEGYGGPFEMDCVRIHFVVTNRASPNRPHVTEELVAKVLAGHSTPLLSQSSTSALSDRIGLSHCFLAARQHGIKLSLTQEGDTVRLVGRYDARLVADCTAASGVGVAALSAAEQRQFPAGLRYQCLDDSMAARHLLKFHITKHLNPAEVLCLGEMEQDVETFVERALEGADVVILDQHLEYTHSYLGLDLLRQLRDGGFPGLLCVRSANNTQLDVALYHRSGAHCVFGKDLPGTAMAEQIKAAWVRLSREGVVRTRLS